MFESKGSGSETKNIVNTFSNNISIAEEDDEFKEESCSLEHTSPRDSTISDNEEYHENLNRTMGQKFLNGTKDKNCITTGES